MDTTGLCRRDALLLALSDVGAFRLGDIGEDAQDEVADEGRGTIRTLSRKRFGYWDPGEVTAARAVLREGICTRAPWNGQWGPVRG